MRQKGKRKPVKQISLLYWLKLGRKAQPHKISVAFTIIELLIVIVVIGVIAAITILVYNGIQMRGREAGIKSALVTTTRQLELQKINTGSYPATTSQTNNGQPPQTPPGATMTYAYNSSTAAYCLEAYVTASPTVVYHTSNGGAPAQGQCPSGGVTVDLTVAFNNYKQALIAYKSHHGTYPITYSNAGGGNWPPVGGGATHWVCLGVEWANSEACAWQGSVIASNNDVVDTQILTEMSPLANGKGPYTEEDLYQYYDQSIVYISGPNMSVCGDGPAQCSFLGLYWPHTTENMERTCLRGTLQNVYVGNGYAGVYQGVMCGEVLP